MELFNKFKETVFYKDDSELEYQIKALEKVTEKYPNNPELNKNLALYKLGLEGEQEIKFELKNANIGMYVLHDVNLEYEDLKAQIDYIIITPAKIYFVECKNLTGNITVDNKGNFIREWYYKDKKIKEGIYSPLRQAERHIEVFKKVWNSRNNSLMDKVRYKYMDNWCVPLVVMANSKNILNIKYAPKEIKNKVIKSDSLVNYLKDDITKTDKDILWKQKDMKECAFSIMQNYNKDINKDYEKKYTKYAEKYIAKIEENNSKLETNIEDRNILELRKKLIEFRKNRAKSMNIPAYYVFTNDEMDQILNLMPKTLDELKNSKILPAIKLKTHGEDIIKCLEKNILY